MAARTVRRVRIAPPALAGWLPPLPDTTLAVTPAGLVEVDAAAADPDLELRFAMPDLPQLLATLAVTL